MARPSLEVADILNRHGEAYPARHRLSRGQLKVMGAIRACRTAALGGHVMRCGDCDHATIAYNSCRSRHCPRCQGAAAKDWLAQRQADPPACALLPSRLHPAGAHRGHRLPEQGRGLRFAVQGRGRDARHHCDRSPALCPTPGKKYFEATGREAHLGSQLGHCDEGTAVIVELKQTHFPNRL